MRRLIDLAYELTPHWLDDFVEVCRGCIVCGFQVGLFLATAYAVVRVIVLLLP